MNAKRDIGPDITRIIACCATLGVHFFLNAGFYDTLVVGKRMFVMVIMRTFFMICVPLFMILSGYLYSERKIVIQHTAIRKHIIKISKIIYTYVICVFFICIFRKFYQHEEISILKDSILKTLGYTEYSWYVNMYIGLFLLIPFLNVLWYGIEDREGHQILICTLLFITMAPSVLNIYDFCTADAIFKPWTSKNYTQIVPDWWTTIYPITYYYIGAYIRKYIDTKKCNPLKLVAALLVCILVFGIYNFFRSYSIKFVKGIWCHAWGSLQNTVMSILVFLIINSIDWKLGLCKKALSELSGLTFSAYLLSWISDSIYYPLLKQYVPDMVLRLNYFPIIVPVVILTSFFLAYLAECILRLLQLLCRYIRKSVRV